MPTVQQRTRENAFAVSYRADTAPAVEVRRATTPGRTYAPAPTPSRPVPGSRSQPRQRVQTAWLLLMVCAAFASVIVGLAYLYGYALVTKEGYRRAQLKSELRQEREMAQQLKQEQALTHTPLHIEQQAHAIGMKPASEQQMVTVGQTIEPKRAL
jgi:hypothetical protein